MSQITGFEQYGRPYQLQLFSEIITDHKFGLTIIELLDPEYFSQDVFKRLVILIKKYHKDHETLMNYNSLNAEVHMQFPEKDGAARAQMLDTLQEMETCPINNLNVQAKALQFCKFRKMQAVINRIKEKVDRNQVEEYESIEEELKSAFIHKEMDDPVGVLDNVDKVLDDGKRTATLTGVDGIDEILDGGLSKGEVGLVIAPLGVGKSTILTKFANNAYKTGKNVVQIFFEDKVTAIQRKHYTIMTDIPLNELSDRREEVKEILNSKKEGLLAQGNHLHLVKLPADGVTVSKIKNIIKKINSKYPKVDMVVLDYIDCLSADKMSPGKEDWSNEGKIMRQFEVMTEELDVASWCATQGSRDSTSLEIVRVGNMGGNLKKAQIAHFIMSIGKTLEQKELNVATISILKNRMGKDGMIFSNCKFDNGKMQISTGEILSEKGFEDQKILKIKETQRELARSTRTDISESEMPF